MGFLQQLTGRYNRNARLVPAILVALPLIVLAVTSVPVLVTIWSKVGTVVVAAGLPFVFAQVVRDRGLRIEPTLYAAWGGRPSEVMLRWRASPTTAAVARRHELIKRHLAITLPDAAAEAADPPEADDAYAVATAALRERTRDTARFHMLFDANINYGFRRNAHACKTPAIVVCVVTAAVTLVVARLSIVSLGWKQQVGLVGFDAAAALAWLWWSTTDAVRRAAETYARQLFASLEVFGNEQSAPSAPPDTT